MYAGTGARKGDLDAPRPTGSFGPGLGRAVPARLEPISGADAGNDDADRRPRADDHGIGRVLAQGPRFGVGGPAGAVPELAPLPLVAAPSCHFWHCPRADAGGRRGSWAEIEPPAIRHEDCSIGGRAH